MNKPGARLMAQICACRLDPSVSADRFVDLLEQLIDLVYAAAVTPEQSFTPTMSGFCGEEDQRALMTTPERSALANSHSMRRPRGARVPHDDKVRIRAEYDAILEQQKEVGRIRAPNGFIDSLADQYGYPRDIVKAICYRKDGS